MGASTPLGCSTKASARLECAKVKCDGWVKSMDADKCAC